MTGEMIKPKNADREEEYWRDQTLLGYRAIGDESFLIRPNYPIFFEFRDEIRKIGFKDADVEPWDTYQGPYIDLKGIDIGKGPYGGSASLRISEMIGSCQIWGTEVPELYSLNCGRNNKKFFGTEEPFVGGKDVILDVLKRVK